MAKKLTPLQIFEQAVFDSATAFTVTSFRGRGAIERQEFSSDLLAAMAACAKDSRACIYAVNPAGRSIVLDRKDWEFWKSRKAAGI